MSDINVARDPTSVRRVDMSEVTSDLMALMSDEIDCWMMRTSRGERLGPVDRRLSVKLEDGEFVAEEGGREGMVTPFESGREEADEPSDGGSRVSLVYAS
jgi:hypothetical protein